jgi:hypothetical protein
MMRTPVGIAAALAALGFPRDAVKSAGITLTSPARRSHSAVGPAQPAGAQPAGAKIRRAMASKQFGLRNKGRM